MHPLLGDVLASRNHARRISSVTILHVSQPAALMEAHFARVPQWDVPSAATAHIPIVELLDRVLLIVRPPWLLHPAPGMLYVGALLGVS